MPRPPTIVRVPFKAPGGPGVALEVMSVAALRSRVPATRLQAAHRVEFYQLVFVTQGRCEHGIDFLTHVGRAGSWLIVRPGQVQRYGSGQAWRGWVLVLRPDLLLPQARNTMLAAGSPPTSLDTLPNHLSLGVSERRASLRCLEQMARDTRDVTLGPELDALLCHQLQALVLRLHMAQRNLVHRNPLSAGSAQRFERYRQMVELKLHQWHQVNRFAGPLGCTERSLTRAALEVVGLSAKAYLNQRIVLEAKRLLVHTSAPIASIAHQLGFEEASNFAKFFKREAMCLPGEFRRQQCGPSTRGRPARQ